MNRVALTPIPLSDGTLIPAGATIAVSAHINEDDSVYPHASTYDGFRFYKKRQEPGHEHRHQLVTTTSENFGFGHGRHACPGRFFAANETKILLVHLLLKYDWKFKDVKGRPRNFEVGTESIADPSVELLFRGRECEVDVRMLGEGV
jgi:cytochrome P450